MRRIPLVAAAPPRRGMDLTITMPPAQPAAAAPGPAPAGGCGPIHLFVADSKLISQTFPEPWAITIDRSTADPDTGNPVVFAVGGIIPSESTAIHAQDVAWDGPGELPFYFPYQLPDGVPVAPMAPFFFVTVYTDTPPGTFRFRARIACPNGSVVLSNIVSLTVV